MKKVLAFALVLTLGVISASAQNEKTQNLRRHLIEQRLHNRQQLKNQAMLHQRQEKMRNHLMRQRLMRRQPLAEANGRKIRMMNDQRRKTMLRRYYLHRRVI